MLTDWDGECRNSYHLKSISPIPRIPTLWSPLRTGSHLYISPPAEDFSHHVHPCGWNNHFMIRAGYLAQTKGQ